ncbi:hypothetical protein N7513_003505 [Penicillium frequentans]|nr:hypothetical protein N7513_003505 [Penicillium glabrum]
MSNTIEPPDTSQEGSPDPTMQLDTYRRNTFRDIVADANVFQFIGSTSGHTTTARQITAQQCTTQCMGELSDSTLRQISIDRSAVAVKKQYSHQHQAGYLDGRGYKLG